MTRRPSEGAQTELVAEREIRPQHIFDEYLRLAAEDAETFFHNEPRYPFPCPACETEGRAAFEKNGFTYCLCDDCRALFVSPRPAYAAFARYYTGAPSAAYWASTFYPATAAARRQKLWKPKARELNEHLSALCGNDLTVVDIGGGFGIFAEEFQTLSGRPVTIIEPGPDLARSCRERGLRVVPSFLEDVERIDLPPGRLAFVSFELFEHLHSPRGFLLRLHQLMNPGDIFVFSTLSGLGADILELWDLSPSVSPPHHLNFLNPFSCRRLLEAIGFEVLSITTPGQLDVDILSNNRDKLRPGFWKEFVNFADDASRVAMQALLAGNGWSSHMLATCRKPLSPPSGGS